MNKKMPKTLYGFPLAVRPWAEDNKIYIMPRLKIKGFPLSIVPEYNKKWEIVITSKMKITKEVREGVKKLIKIYERGIHKKKGN